MFDAILIELAFVLGIFVPCWGVRRGLLWGTAAAVLWNGLGVLACWMLLVIPEGHSGWEFQTMDRRMADWQLQS
jgi:hypothetical protein